MEDMEYENTSVVMQDGDALFLYTDGVPEAKNLSGDRFGTDKMLEILNKNKESSLDVQLGKLKEEIDGFAGEGDPFDDVTMLIFRVGK